MQKYTIVHCICSFLLKCLLAVVSFLVYRSCTIPVCSQLMICGITPINTFLMWHKNMVSIIIKEIMMEPWKNPISTAVSALDMRLSVLDWVSRELADISSYSMACVSLVVMDCLPHGERALIQRQWLISTTAAIEMIRCWAYLHLSSMSVGVALIFFGS